MSRKNDAERQEALERLRKWLAPGDTVYTIIRHVSRSVMQRRIGVVLLQPDDTDARVGLVPGHRAKLIDLHPNWAVAKAVGARLASGNQDAVIVNGCGMDMGFHLVYETSARMFPDGFGCVGEGCPSNDHTNGDRDYTPSLHDTFKDTDTNNGREHEHSTYCHWHRDGGYALRQRWL